MNRARPKQIVIRLSEKEKEILKKKVKKSGLKQQDFLIKCILEKQVLNTDGLKEVTPELKRIGVNLNQIAKSCNQGNQVSYEEIQIIGKELNEVWQLLKRLAQGQV